MHEQGNLGPCGGPSPYPLLLLVQCAEKVGNWYFLGLRMLVSLCSDQALKRLLGGGDWEALDWQKQSKGRIQVPVLGQGHHTAGFCLGETSMHLCPPHQHGTINKGLI